MSRPELQVEDVAAQDRWQSADEFKACVRAWAERIGVRPTRIQIQKAKKKWGSCSPGGVLTFSSDLLAKPRAVGEAVIVHELIHLKVPNHGRLFRSLLRAHMPEAEQLLAQNRVIGS